MPAKPWLASYSPGVPAEIDPDRHPSLVALLEASFARFGAQPAFTNLGTTLTFREVERLSRAFAAYLHLRHGTVEKSAWIVASSDGLLIVDYSSSGRAVGVEITAPRAVPLERLNALLVELGEAPLAEREYAPALAA